MDDHVYNGGRLITDRGEYIEYNYLSIIIMQRICHSIDIITCTTSLFDLYFEGFVVHTF